MQYPVIFEKCENSYSAYVPDLPGCIAVGNTLEEARESIAEAIEFHIEALREAGYPVPVPSVQNHPINPKDDKDNEWSPEINRIRQSQTVAKNRKGENDEQSNQ